VHSYRLPDLDTVAVLRGVGLMTGGALVVAFLRNPRRGQGHPAAEHDPVTPETIVEIVGAWFMAALVLSVVVGKLLDKRPEARTAIRNDAAVVTDSDGAPAPTRGQAPQPRSTFRLRSPRRPPGRA
jgi:hypothetical protein